MKTNFIKYINENSLFEKKNKLLLALSGGIDSMVLFHLLLKSNYNFEVAHCNFKLRKKDSDLDEKFISDSCNSHKIKYFTKTFNTKAYAKENKISVQVAARELRYNWFEKIRNENNFDYILLAHHADDVIETFHINLIRGTGLKGLTGIKSKTNKLIRPLLFSSRKEIEAYAQKNNIAFRLDKSNLSNKYLRNKLRLDILPEFNKLNPSYTKNLLQTINRLDEIEKTYDYFIQEKKQQIVKIENNNILIKIEEINKLPAPKAILYEYIKEFGFENEIIDKIFNTKDKQSGKVFKSENYELIKDRKFYIIKKIEQNIFETIFLQVKKATTKLSDNELIETKITPIDPNFKIDKNPEVALLDFEKLETVLTLEKWEKGDYFFPLGMNKRKKLSDFFIDKKYSLFEKENQLILKSKGEIIWIVGKAIDNRYKVSENTKIVFSLKYIKK